MKRLLVCLACLMWLSVAMFLSGQDGDDAPAGARGGGGGARGGAAQNVGRSNTVTTLASFNPAQVRRGQALFLDRCASCHGVDARGGSGRTDVDLLRQPIVMMDITGKQLGDFLEKGRPEKGMPAFEFTPDQASEISAFLRYEISDFVAGRGGPRHNVFSGDAKAGETFFNGPVGKCNTCHSVTGDLKGVGGRTNDDAPSLQTAILAGTTGQRGRKPNVTVTVTLKDGRQFVGEPRTVNDWLVEIQLENGSIMNWLPNGGWPKVTTTNRLQAHVDLMLKYTDDDIHNLAAYLRGK